MSKPLITIGDGTDRQVTIFRSRSGSLCFEFWDTDVSNACVDYDWESTQVFVEKDEEDKLFQELLKKQDRSALLWALLEEEAGEVVEVGVCAGDPDFKWTYLGETLQVSSAGLGLFLNRWQDGFEDPIDDFFVGSCEAARMVILCLARAIQEQKKWEAGVQGA